MFFSMSVVRRRADDLQAFVELGRAFARDLRAGDVVALEGDLGAGKTTFVAAAVAELAPLAEVSSPTFIFWQHYEGPIPIEHLDLYRVDPETDLAELGLSEAFDPDAIVFVEWPDRVPGLVPPGATRVRIAGGGDGPRDVTIERR